MAIRWMIGAALLVAGCSDDIAANDRVTSGSEAATQPECHGFADVRCIALLPAERMQGVWLSGFERSSFLAGAKSIPKGPSQFSNAVWFDFAPGVHPAPALRAEMDRIGGTVAVAIEFDGRRSRDAGRYGHMGGARHIVVVDRIYTAHILGQLDSN